MVSPQTSVKVVGGHDKSVEHTLAIAFDDVSMDVDLRETLATTRSSLGMSGLTAVPVLVWSVPLRAIGLWNNH